MTVRPVIGPLERGSRDRDIDELLGRVNDLERFPPGRWIYADDGTGDPDVTPDSPVFVNGTNVGGGLRRLRFRRTNEWGFEVAGSVTGLVAGDVVVNVAELYRPTEAEYAVGTDGTDGVTVWLLQANGDLVYVGAVVTGAGSDTSAIHYDVANVGGSLDIATTTGNIDLDADSQNLGLTAFNINLFAANDIQSFLAGLFGVFADSGVDLYSESTGIEIRASSIQAFLDAASTFTLFDSLGNKMLEMTEGSPDLHIPAGGNVIADL